MLAVLARSQQDVGNLCKKFVSFKISARSWQDITEIQKKLNFMARSCHELNKIWETHKHHGEISAISPRWRKSRHDLTEIQKLANIMVRSLQYRQDLDHLGGMEDISPRSRRNLECRKHHGEMFTISAISAILARWRISRHDLAKI